MHFAMQPENKIEKKTCYMKIVLHLSSSLKI